MLKNHVFGSSILNNSEIFRLSFEDIFFGNTRHLYEKYEPTLGSSGGVHGKGCWLIAYMVPVPKDKRGSKSDSNNYRAIAIISILGKLFDSIIIKEQHSSLITDDLQFGFKENSSTIICTQLLIETIEYYNSEYENTGAREPMPP